MDKDERNDFRQEPSQEEKRPLKQFIRRLAGKSSQDDSQENLPPGEEDKRRRRRVKLATFGAAACTVLFLATAAEIARVPDTDSSGPSTAQVMSELPVQPGGRMHWGLKQPCRRQNFQKSRGRN